MKTGAPRVFPLALTLAVAALVIAVGSSVFARARQQQVTGASREVMPGYDTGRNLMLPDDYRRWILVGSSIGLSYSENAQERGHEMFNTTLMEPSAYQHFVKTGAFREGTMLALIAQGIGSNTLPARRGQFAADVHAVEMAVKDSKRVPEGWAYYRFGGPMTGGYSSTAAPEPKASCYACHDQHAARDHVFTQFYGLLNEAAPAKR